MKHKYEVFNYIQTHSGHEEIMTDIEKKKYYEQFQKNRRNERKRKPFQRMSLLAKVACLVIGIVVLGSSAAYAAHLLWNHDVADMYDVAEEDDMQKYNEEGFSNLSATTVTDQDITVNVLQTIADKNFAFVYLEVKFGEAYDLKDLEQYLPVMRACLNDSITTGHLSKEVAEVKDAHTVTYKCIFSDDAELRDGDQLSLDIIGFTDSNYGVKENANELSGKWTLQLPLKIGSTKRVYHVNKKVKIHDWDVTFDRIELTPFSCVMYVDAPKGIILGQYLDVYKFNNGDFARDEKGNKILLDWGLALELYDNMDHKQYGDYAEGEDLLGVSLIDITKIIMIDGSDFGSIDGAFGPMEIAYVNGQSRVKLQFGMALDLDQVKSIYNNDIEMNLEGINFDLVED